MDYGRAEVGLRTAYTESPMTSIVNSLDARISPHGTSAKERGRTISQKTPHQSS